MNRLRTMLALGLLVGGSGCAALNRGAGSHPIAERAAVAPQGETAIDPFHPPAETPSARISRYFPGLTRATASIAPASDGLRRGSRPESAHDRDREAVPRPGHDLRGGPDDETATASVSPASRRAKRPRAVESA